MADVRTKNPYELLGNDPELDPDREPAPPTKVADKPAPRHGKRDVPTEPPRANPTAARGRGQRLPANEAAFRDREAGSQVNRNKPVDEVPMTGRPLTGGMKNRDIRGNLVREDRHSRTDRTVTGKQAAQGWGSKAGDQTLLDEKVGEEIARTEEQEEGGATPAEGNEAAEQAEQERAKSYAEYLAELEQQKNDELGVKEARKPNEGVKVNSQWATAKELKRAEDEDAYIRGKEEKARREKQRKEKTYVDVDMRFVEPSRGGRGEYRGRGRGRGGPDRDGPERRERPDRPERGRGGPRGGGAPRGGRGVTVDEKNFPSLGAK